MADKNEDNVCRRATEIALEIAREECGGEKAMMKHMGKLLGMDEDEAPNPSSDCEVVLDEGLIEEVCKDFREIRRWVLCRAWQLLDSKEVDTFEVAMETAWAEAKNKCRERGVPV